LETKQDERFGEAITMFNDFKEKYPNSKFLKEAEDIRKDSEEGIANAKRVLAEVAETKNDKDKNKQDIKTSKNEQ
jgi:outer membrane protein assembly factor BamD